MPLYSVLQVLYGRAGYLLGLLLLQDRLPPSAVTTGPLADAVRDVSMAIMSDGRATASQVRRNERLLLVPSNAKKVVSRKSKRRRGEEVQGQATGACVSSVLQTGGVGGFIASLAYLLTSLLANVTTPESLGLTDLVAVERNFLSPSTTPLPPSLLSHGFWPGPRKLCAYQQALRQHLLINLTRLRLSQVPWFATAASSSTPGTAKALPGRSTWPDRHAICFKHPNLSQVPWHASASSSSRSPLFYAWHGKPYLGAAHGLVGILHALLSCLDTAQQYDTRATDDIQGALR